MRFYPPATQLSYGATVLAFLPLDARYIRLKLSGCPQPLRLNNFYSGCGLGEVAIPARERPNLWASLREARSPRRLVPKANARELD